MKQELRLEDLQSFDDLDGVYSIGPLKTEKRRSPRQKIQASGQLSVAGALIEVVTTDISLRGASILAGEQLGVGTEGSFRLWLSAGAEEVTLLAHVRLVHCFYSGHGTYKAGLEFLSFSSGEDSIRAILSATDR